MKIFLIIYITSILINTVLMYFDKDVKTIGDLFERWWINLIPFFNIIITLYILSEISIILWGKIKNVKIK